MITIHTDGACLGNPGPGSFAAIIETQEKETTASGGNPSTTNNRMEMSAVIEALGLIANEEARTGTDPATLRTDSQYIAKAFNDHWLDNWLQNGWKTAKGKPVENQDLWHQLLELTEGRNITWTWVKGHSGDPMNERCDSIAYQQAQLATDINETWTFIGTPRSHENSPANNPMHTANPEFPANPESHPESPAAQPADRLQALEDDLAATKAHLQAVLAMAANSPSFPQFRDKLATYLRQHPPVS